MKTITIKTDQDIDYTDVVNAKQVTVTGEIVGVVFDSNDEAVCTLEINGQKYVMGIRKAGE